jgi:hypothetical protein
MDLGGTWPDPRMIAALGCPPCCISHSVISRMGWLKRAIDHSTNRPRIGQRVACEKPPPHRSARPDSFHTPR